MLQHLLPRYSGRTSEKKQEEESHRGIERVKRSTESKNARSKTLAKRRRSVVFNKTRS